jgi:hypothetical protein
MGRRVVAYIIDFCIAGIVLVGLFLATADTQDKAEFGLTGVTLCDDVRDTENVSLCFENDDTIFTVTGGSAVAVFVVPLVISFANYVLLQGATGATVGKYVLGLRVVEGSGGNAGIGRSFVRWLLLIVDTLCLVLGLIVALATKPHRRVGDFVAGTYVIGKDDVGRPIVPGPGLVSGVGAPYAPAPSTYAPPAGFAPPSGPRGWSPHGPLPADPMPTEAPTTEVPTSGAPPVATSAPQWDAQRNAWVTFDGARNAWLRYDDAAGEWRALD